MTNVRTINLAVSVQVEGHPSAEEIAGSVREDFAVSPIEGQVACEVTVADQSDSEGEPQEPQPSYIVVLLGEDNLPGSEIETHGPFTGQSGLSSWREARSFIERSVHRTDGDSSRWCVCTLNSPGEAA